MRLDCAGKILDLSRPAVMGVLNVTPDSFSDGGRYLQLDAALRQSAAVGAGHGCLMGAQAGDAILLAYGVGPAKFTQRR